MSVASERFTERMSGASESMPEVYSRIAGGSEPMPSKPELIASGDRIRARITTYPEAPINTGIIKQ